MGKTLYIADFGDHGQGKEILDTFVTGQGLSRFYISWRIGQHRIERF